MLFNNITARENFVNHLPERRYGKMWKYCFFIWFLAGALAFSAGAETFSLPKIHYDAEERVPEVKATGTWKKLPVSNSGHADKTPPGTLAAQLAEDGFLFTWRPSPDVSRVLQAADLTGAQISEDGSLLIIAERIGGAGSNNSTRFVFINLISGNICGGFELPLRRITAFYTIPGTPEKIIAVQDEQLQTKTEHKLLLIDLKRRSVSAESAPQFRPVTSVATDGRRLWFSLSNSNDIMECDVALTETPLSRHQTKHSVRRLLFHPKSNSIIAWQHYICEYFSIKPSMLYLEHTVQLPAYFSQAWAAVVPGIANAAVFVDNNGRGIYVSPGGYVTLPGKLEPYGVALSGNQVIIGSSDRMKLANIILPDAILKGFYAPNSLQPHNRNKTRFLLARKTTPAELIQVDERGNVFKITLTGRRGRKTVLLLVNKHGIK